MPGVVPYLSTFYKNSEMSFRLAILGSGLSVSMSTIKERSMPLMLCNQISRALLSLLAAGILTLRGVNDRPGQS